MNYNNCKYLFLSDTNRELTGTSAATWNNIPSLTNSTRECYLTVINAKIVFNSNQIHGGITLKAVLPVRNYTSTDNDSPVIADLEALDQKVYAINKENQIHLLSNDNLKKVEIIVQDDVGTNILLVGGDSLEIMFKIEYVNQEQQTENYIKELPKYLN